MDHEKLFESMLPKRKVALFAKMCADQMPLWAWWAAGFSLGSWKFMGFVMVALGVGSWTLHTALESAMGLLLVGCAGYMFMWIASDMAADVASEGRRPFGEVAKISGKARLSCLLESLGASWAMGLLGQGQLDDMAGALGGAALGLDFAMRAKMVSALCVDWAVVAMVSGPLVWIALGMAQWAARVAPRSRWYESRYGNASRTSVIANAAMALAKASLRYPKRRLAALAKKIVEKGLEDPAVRASIEAQSIDDAMAPSKDAGRRRQSKRL